MFMGISGKRSMLGQGRARPAFGALADGGARGCGCDGFVDLVELFAHGIFAVPAPDMGFQPLSEPRSKRRRLQQREQRLGELLGIAGPGEQARLPPVENLGTLTHCRRDDRQSGGSALRESTTQIDSRPR